MTLREAIEKGFDRFNNGQNDSISLLDIEGETIKVVSINELSSIDDKYLDSDFISIGSSSIVPTRLRIRLKYKQN